jgi:hypothetical protein
MVIINFNPLLTPLGVFLRKYLSIQPPSPSTSSRQDSLSYQNKNTRHPGKIASGYLSGMTWYLQNYRPGGTDQPSSLLSQLAATAGTAAGRQPSTINS